MSENAAALHYERALQDAALINAGAEFEGGQLYVPNDVIEHIADGDTLAAPVTNLANIEHATKLIVDTAIIGPHRAKRLSTAFEAMNPDNPVQYLQGIRDYLKRNADDKNSGAPYQLQDPYATNPIAGNREQLDSDITALVPLNNLWVTGSGEYYDSNWKTVAPGAFIANARAMYAVTMRMKRNAAQYNLPNQLDVPSFDALTHKQRHEILQTMKHEWESLEAELPEGVGLTYRTPSLMYRAVHELQDAYAQYPNLSQSQIAKAFLKWPIAFNRVLADMHAKSLQTPAAPKQRVRPMQTLREQRLRNRAQQLLESDELDRFSESLQIGEIVYPKTIDQIDEVVFATLAQMEDSATDAHGEARRNVWRSRTISNLSAARKMRPLKFNGRLLNPRVMVMPVDDELIDAYCTKIDDGTAVDRQSFVRLAAIADMHSTGRGIIGQSVVDIMLYTRNSEDPDNRQHILSIRGTNKGALVADYVNNESAQVATAALTYALQNPYSGGLIGSR